MKNRKFKHLNKKLLTASILSAALFCQPQAAPLPNGTLLSIEQGVGSGTNQFCTTGSCFGMEVAPGLVIWTDFGPGTEGGIVAGKSQASGRQELAASRTIDTPGEMTSAWYFFGNYGTFYTPIGSTNLFNDTSCTGVACIGATELNSWNWAWNGVSTPMGSANGCNSVVCTTDQLDGIFIESWVISADEQAYQLKYNNVLPDGDPSSFGNVKFSLVLRSAGVPPNVILPDASFTRPAEIVVNQPAQFTDTTRFIGGDTDTIVSWSWDFGDGNTSTEQNPFHTYTQLGSYTVNLTVTDNSGDVDTASQVVRVPTLSVPAGSILGIDPGAGSGTNQSCTRGSCFSMEVAPGLFIWTDFGPGTDGGIVVGKNQASGGQELALSATNSTPGEITNAWNFFANFGTLYTPTGASDNVVSDASCAGASCIGNTQLSSLNMAWNGHSIPLGSLNGCNSFSCSPEELAGDHIVDYTIAGNGNPWNIQYHSVVPNGDPSGFGNVRFEVIMHGIATLATPTPTLIPTPSLTPSPTPEPTPIPTTCESLYPQTEITMLGKGKNLEVEETMTTTFRGHIVSTDEAKGKVTICRGSTVSYEVVSMVGTAKCKVKHGVSTETTGTLTDKGKLVCTNKPDGKDTDKFKIKRSKKKDVAVERRWFR